MQMEVKRPPLSKLKVRATTNQNALSRLQIKSNKTKKRIRKEDQEFLSSDKPDAVATDNFLSQLHPRKLVAKSKNPSDDSTGTETFEPLLPRTTGSPRLIPGSPLKGVVGWGAIAD
ncbi:hypothetical protein CDAR_256691 [Caerostris darwini]|uniref:Uncharacterized protein n=1 Tax=Caerostris darwini TaxID=1538125 RepID=A0AAV4Q2V3_9ARAC|nr:hypothetical protein CDAR_256691 [Caerostris darwini]